MEKLEVPESQARTDLPVVGERPDERIDGFMIALRTPEGRLLLHVMPEAYWFEQWHLVVELDPTRPEDPFVGMGLHCEGDMRPMEPRPFHWSDAPIGTLRFDLSSPGRVRCALDLRHSDHPRSARLKGALEMEVQEGEYTGVLEQSLKARSS